jgi:hypothetical protein
MTPIDFEVAGSKVKVTEIFTIISILLKCLRIPVCSVLILTFKAWRIHSLAMHWLSNLRFGREVVLEL